jgi:hypothetical protein
MSNACLAAQKWVESVVVGLELCPFAAPVLAQGRLRIVSTEAETPEELATALDAELAHLLRAPVEEVETTLLVHPRALLVFDEYNDFLDVVDALLVERGCEGVVQIASFHPDYRFEGSPADDAANWTNRAPFPMLHLLREASVEEAIDSFGDTAEVPERNSARLRELGADAMRSRVAACLEVDASSD